MNLAKKLLMTTGTSSGTVPAPSGGYVDDVFSAYTYTGNGSTQTINNGIDLAGEGGLVWTKIRSVANDHFLVDTVRGGTKWSAANRSDIGENTTSPGLTFSSSGYDLPSNFNNTAPHTFVSWTFRRAPKFFDVVTYTGNGATGRQIAHSLGQTPGMIIVKRVSGTNEVGGVAGYWFVYHRSLANSEALLLNTTDSKQGAGVWDTTTPTSTQFTVSSAYTNYNGDTYVAYLFAHDPSAEGIIQCGSFTGNTTVNIGWEPQWIMIKRTDATGNWIVIDSMRGCSVGGVDAVLNPNLTNVDSVSNDYIDFTTTGFITKNLTGTHVYTVIRRPNKPPTSGTQVYNCQSVSDDGYASPMSVGFNPDWFITKRRATDYSWRVHTRLIGDGGVWRHLAFCTSDAEYIFGSATEVKWDVSNSIVGLSGYTGGMRYSFRRAPGFFDVVCDTGTGVAHAIAHNLTKAPELIIRKSRSAATQWEVWHSALAATEKLVLNSNAAKATDTAAWNSTLPTATQFTVGTGANVNANTATFVTYLFATLAGVSKVGSYSGNGGTQTIPCGFTTGSRFILIKRVDNTGDWFVWDTARGITPTTDPHLSLNTSAAEVTTDDSIDQDASGFIVNQNAATNINALGGNYLFLAIA